MQRREFLKGVVGALASVGAVKALPEPEANPHQMPWQPGTGKGWPPSTITPLTEAKVKEITATEIRASEETLRQMDELRRLQMEWCMQKTHPRLLVDPDKGTIEPLEPGKIYHIDPDPESPFARLARDWPNDELSSDDT